MSYWGISHTENIAYDIEDTNNNVTRDTFVMLLGISATFYCRELVLLTAIMNQGPTDLRFHRSVDR